ncbi:hydantoinase B/oxoprolinase family protein [Gracilibacillus alcaliphilus]|uniref:hydantoinase B/oxoprolinase family protein n=1 Tax=Gracilibacillus alcaliphilus TaxID=1401441 RepID=UPI001956D4B7|nr:hydantoinase B/oxoprolinase family protein [Gracilibacillus alcaliphilus]MBM7679250.1 N-methylhydantoinase B [Gracilibacillus alcaliphilus]
MIEEQIQYSKLQAISRQMGETLQRISRSPLVSQDRAFAAAIFTNELELAVQHQFKPEHLFAVKESVAHLFDYFSFDISDGDVLLVADPYNGGTKGQSLTMAAPLFYQGELVLFPVIRVQMIDLAGEFPGGFHPNAFEIWQESMRITPIKLYKQGLLQRDVLKFLLANSRVKSLYEAELNAMYACLRAAQTQLLSLMKHGKKQLDHAISVMSDYSHRRILEQIKQFPNQDMHSELTFNSNAEVINLHVTIKALKDRLKINFEGTSKQVQTPVNAALSTTKAYAVWPVLAPIAEEVAINEGLLQAFDVVVPKGSVLAPKFPAAVGLSTVITGHYIAEVITKALKNNDTADDLYLEIHGPGPQAILFPPFGKERETEPLFLAPGFPESLQGWGPSALFGDRKLVSAEELEFNYHFKMVKREQKDKQMIIQIINQGASFDVITIIPEKAGRSYGEIKMDTKENNLVLHGSTVGNRLNHGDEIAFIYERGGHQ